MENNAVRLAELRAEVKKRARIINCPIDEIETYSPTNDSYVEVDSTEYHDITQERGNEISCFTTASLDEFLEHLFVDRTFKMATEYELKNRIEGKDSRRIWFQHQIELLTLLSPEWAKRESERQSAILKKHPFSDE